MNQIRHEYLAETEDLIEQILADVDELREKHEDSRFRRELLDSLFRRVHSVKGSAASFGLAGLSELAHEFEALLGAMRAGRASVNHTVLDTCESAAAALSESLNLAASGVVEPSRRALFERIQRLVEVDRLTGGQDTGSILNEVPSGVWQSLNEAEKHRLVQAVGEGAHLFVVETRFDLANFDEQFYKLREKLAENGEVISTSPIVDAAHPQQINFRILYTSAADLRVRGEDALGFSGVVVTQLAGASSAQASVHGADTASGATPVPSFSNFIRIDLTELDRLISSAHELFHTTKNALDLASGKNEKRTPPELDKLAAKIRHSFMALEDEIINLRMVSVGRVLRRAERAGRAAARAAKKEIDFEIRGSEIRMDKLLCDAVADPLVHLVRNSVDHGIETVEERARLEKPKRGLVRIEVVSEGCQTRVSVIDDGRGIDPELVSRAAMELGIIGSGINLDIERSLRLIFRPGFSTLSSVSITSGRGVGLDVVENSVEQVGGEVRVSSEAGCGATFEIRLPVTFGLLRATVVFLAGHRYCLDASQVVSTEMCQTNQIENGKEGEVIRSQNEVLPVFHLRELLGQSPRETHIANQLAIIVCQIPWERAHRAPRNGKRIALVVDRVEGTEEVLVRNMGRYAGRWFGIAGATELSGGAVALVLDLPRLLSGTGG